MSEPAHAAAEERTRAGASAAGPALAPPSARSHQPPERLSPTAMDGAFRSVQAEIASVADARDTGPADERAVRDGMIALIERIPISVMRMIEDGTARGLRELAVPDHLQRPLGLDTLLGYAAAMAVGGAAGAIAVSVAKGIAGSLQKKFVEDGLKEAIKRGLKVPPVAAARGPVPDLREAFKNKLEDQRSAAYATLDREFVGLHVALSHLTTAELRSLSDRLLEHEATHAGGELHEQVADQTIIAWTNFLAQATHGAMGTWDLWQQHGSAPGAQPAVPLDGAHPVPRTAKEAQAVTSGNVDPRAATAITQASDHEQVGVLEISVDLQGALLTSGRGVDHGHAYGMQLASVGPRVRARLQQLGRVRDVPINKLIRIYDTHERSVTPIGAVLVTADGYVRHHDLGVETRVHRDPRPLSLEESIGIEARAFRVNVEANTRLVRELAERAQDLPLSLLEA